MAADAAEQETQPRRRRQPPVSEWSREGKDAPRLRRLEFARVAAARAVVCLAALYGLAKSRVGPLRPAVDAAESAASRFVDPALVRFRGTCLVLLAFLDRKVDRIVQALHRRLPPGLKAASARAYAAAQDVPELARELLAEARKSGVAGAGRAAYAKAEPAAKGLYLRYGPGAGRLAVSVWRSLHRLPLFPQAARVAVPAAARCAEGYNSAVSSAAARGYAGARYLPAIPIELVARFFCEGGVAAANKAE